MRILIVEMDTATRDALKECLDNWGHEVNFAENAAVARKLLNESDYGLIIVDHYTFLHFNLKKDGLRNKKVLILDSYKGVENTFKEVKPVCILKKPFNIEDLENKCK